MTLPRVSLSSRPRDLQPGAYLDEPSSPEAAGVLNASVSPAKESASQQDFSVRNVGKVASPIHKDFLNNLSEFESQFELAPALRNANEAPVQKEMGAQTQLTLSPRLDIRVADGRSPHSAEEPSPSPPRRQREARTGDKARKSLQPSSVCDEHDAKLQRLEMGQHNGRPHEQNVGRSNESVMGSLAATALLEQRVPTTHRTNASVPPSQYQYSYAMEHSPDYHSSLYANERVEKQGHRFSDDIARSRAAQLLAQQSLRGYMQSPDQIQEHGLDSSRNSNSGVYASTNSQPQSGRTRAVAMSSRMPDSARSYVAPCVTTNPQSAALGDSHASPTADERLLTGSRRARSEQDQIGRLVEKHLEDSHYDRNCSRKRFEEQGEYHTTFLGGLDGFIRSFGWDVMQTIGCGPADDCSRECRFHGTTAGESIDHSGQFSPVEPPEEQMDILLSPAIAAILESHRPLDTRPEFRSSTTNGRPVENLRRSGAMDFSESLLAADGSLSANRVGTPGVSSAPRNDRGTDL